jgi:hypothetical protein
MRSAEEQRQDQISPTKNQEIRPAGTENLARLEGNLWRNKAAIRYLLGLGISSDTIRKFHLGIKEPYRRKPDDKIISGVLCYPLISYAGETLGRYGYYAIPGVTENPLGEGGWGPGQPMTYYSGDITGKRALLVVSSCRELWVLNQQLTGTELEKTAAIISRSHEAGVPEEWKQVEFWSGWSAVFFLQGDNNSCEQVAHCLMRYCQRKSFG